MKRSQINNVIDRAIEVMDSKGIKLPPWGYWTREHWDATTVDANEIRLHGLGWNVTDFGSGDFQKTGLVLFVVRNGCLQDNQPITTKTYAEKYLIVDAGQVVPWHFHWAKTEDLINRSGAPLEVELGWAAEDERSLADRTVAAQVDGITKVMPGGARLQLQPGESVTLPPLLCHQFSGSEGGMTVAGEVSSLNDDGTDNCFLGRNVARSAIIEDEPAKYYLLDEYPAR